MFLSPPPNGLLSSFRLEAVPSSTLVIQPDDESQERRDRSIHKEFIVGGRQQLPEGRVISKNHDSASNFPNPLTEQPLTSSELPLELLTRTTMPLTTAEDYPPPSGAASPAPSKTILIFYSSIVDGKLWCPVSGCFRQGNRDVPTSAAV